MIPGEKILWKITILFGIAGALTGLLLRYFFVSPLSFNFRFMLHAHSHVMLLGWVFSALLLLVYRQWDKQMPKTHRSWFAGMCLCVLGMLFSFPFQGYAAVSIIFSTLHIFLSYILLVKIWKLSRGRALPGKLIRGGIVFFFVSTLGPYSLGVLMANDMQGTNWYDQAVFFYLHFQYNGAFLLFMLAFILQKWKRDHVRWREKLFLGLLIPGIVLNWLHSLDYSFDVMWINIGAGAGAVLQLAAGVLLFFIIDRERAGKAGLGILAALTLKWIFEILGSFPVFADPVVENRSLLIAYLHFIFLGIFTPFIWINLKQRPSPVLSVYGIFFLLTELVLILPSFNPIPGFVFWPQITFALYTGLVLTWLYLGINWLRTVK